MEKPLPEKKSKLLTWTVVAIIAILITSVVLYRLYVGTPVTGQLNDPENDLVLTVGTQHPGMVDVVSAKLEANGKTLSVNVNVRDPISDLGDGEYAQWNVTLILENETDVLKIYEVCVEMNSTDLTGYVVEVEEQKMQGCQVNRSKNSLTVLAVIDELQGAKEVEWFILTIYERFSGDELTTSASDIAPDEGLQKTVLKRETTSPAYLAQPFLDRSIGRAFF